MARLRLNDRGTNNPRDLSWSDAISGLMPRLDEVEPAVPYRLAPAASANAALRSCSRSIAAA